MKYRLIHPAKISIMCFLLLTSLALQLSAQPLGGYFPPPETEGGWRKNTDPAFIRSLGIDPDKLEEFGRFNLAVENSSWKPYSDHKGIIVIKDGWIIGEWYNNPGASDFKTYISSNGKAFSMTLFGAAVRDSRNGKIGHSISPESPVYDHLWLPEGFPLSDQKKTDITFEHIFRHNSGICPERTNTGKDVEGGRNEWSDYRDWVVGHDSNWPVTGSLLYDPGHAELYSGSTATGRHKIAYSSVSFCHIGLVLENIYGSPSHRLLNERIAAPIGMSEIEFHAPPSDSLKWFSAGGVRITPRDYARFAWLLMNDGRWKRDRVTHPGWIRRFRTSDRYPNIRSNIDGVFGTRYPKDMFRIAGSGLNWAFMVPSMNLIALRTGRANNSEWNDVEKEFLEKMFAFVENYEAQDKAPPKAVRGEYLPRQIIANPRFPVWLMRADGTPFFMCGPGDPEGFLYRGELNSDGTRSGDQAALIEKLRGTGANCIYLMAVRSHGGDGDNTENPFIDNDPSRGINTTVLDQWEEWFSVMDDNDIVIYFYLYDDSALVWDTDDFVGEKERTFIRTLVDRFEHHENLIWCIAEEYQEKLSPARVKNIAMEIWDADDYNHIIAVHKLHGLDFSEFADDPIIDQFAVQYNVSTADSLHRGMVDAREAARFKFGLNMSECAEYGTGAEARRKSWAAAMGGAYVMALGMDIESTPVSDLEDCGRLVRFFQSTDFYKMIPHDELAFGDTDYVLASRDATYIVYSQELKTSMGLRNLPAGTYLLRWFDCVTRIVHVQAPISHTGGSVSWERPKGIGKEAALHIRMK